jgi:hypothetical protein
MTTTALPADRDRTNEVDWLRSAARAARSPESSPASVCRL